MVALLLFPHFFSPPPPHRTMCPSITRTSEEVDTEVVFIVLPKRLACLTSDHLQVMLFIIGSSSSEGKMRGQHARSPPPLPPPSHASNVSHPHGKANTLPPPPSPHRPASNKRFPILRFLTFPSFFISGKFLFLWHHQARRPFPCGCLSQPAAFKLSMGKITADYQQPGEKESNKPTNSPHSVCSVCVPAITGLRVGDGPDHSIVMACFVVPSLPPAVGELSGSRGR